MKCSKIVLIAVIILTGVLGTTYAQEADESYTVGIIGSVSIPPFIEGVKGGLTELGYVEGENITYIHDPSLNSEEPDLMTEAIQAMIEAEVDLIITTLTPETVMVQQLTSDIPVVFGLSEDPVDAGLVESLLKPGSNITGSIDGKPNERRLQIMAEIDPTISKVYYPYEPTRPGAESLLERIKETADELDIEIYAMDITDTASILEILENIPEDIDGGFLTTSSLALEFFSEWHAISVFPQVLVSRSGTEATDGVVIGYGPDMGSIGQQAARIADQILRGAEPAEMPVQTAQHFLSINLAAAAEIGLEIPRGILRQADTIIRPGDLDEE